MKKALVTNVQLSFQGCNDTSLRVFPGILKKWKNVINTSYHYTGRTIRMYTDAVICFRSRSHSMRTYKSWAQFHETFASSNNIPERHSSRSSKANVEVWRRDRLCGQVEFKSRIVYFPVRIHLYTLIIFTVSYLSFSRLQVGGPWEGTLFSKSSIWELYRSMFTFQIGHL